MDLRRKISIAVLLLVALSALTWAGNTTLHVRISEGEEEQINLNLPVSVVSALLPLLVSQVEPHLKGNHIQLGEQELGVAQLREIWSALRAEGSYELANIRSDTENVRVRLEEDTLLVDTDESSEDQIHIRLPVSVVDELLSGDEDELNLAAALEKLVSLGASDLVEVRSQDSHVRVWMD